MKDFFGSKFGRVWLAGVGALLVLALVVSAFPRSSETSAGGSGDSVYVEPSGDPSASSDYDTGTSYDGGYTSSATPCNYAYQGRCYEEEPRLANGCPVNAPYPQSAAPGNCATSPNPYYNR